MPQFDQISEIYLSQLFWLAVFFGAIFVVIGLGMLPKIMGTVDARDAKIADDLKAAEGARDFADKLEDDYRAAMDKTRGEANRLAAEAKDKAAKATEAALAKADKANQAKLDKAIAKVGESRAQAMAEIEGVAAEAAQAMVERVAGMTVDASAARAAVAKELNLA